MPATISLKAHFDGQQIQLDEPFELPRDVPLLVTVLQTSESDAERQAWMDLSTQGLVPGYSDNEPDYSDVEILP